MGKHMIKETIQEASKIIKNADTIFISAGAGMGVDSGLPDFRGNTGFWKAYPVLQDENLSFQELANPQWFLENPNRAWGFYGHRYELYEKTIPHDGFSLLQKWSKTKSIAPFVFTTNVDGHFQKSGFSEESIYECHGSINYLQCVNYCSTDIWQMTPMEFTVDNNTLRGEGTFPHCPNCGGLARPNILMFNDWHWIPDRSNKQKDIYKDWIYENKSKNIAIIELGAGKAIPTARHASEYLNQPIIRINPRDSDGPPNTISIPLGALATLSQIDKYL